MIGRLPRGEAGVRGVKTLGEWRAGMEGRKLFGGKRALVQRLSRG